MNQNCRKCKTTNIICKDDIYVLEKTINLEKNILLGSNYVLISNIISNCKNCGNLINVDTNIIEKLNINKNELIIMYD